MIICFHTLCLSSLRTKDSDVSTVWSSKVLGKDAVELIELDEDEWRRIRMAGTSLN